MCHYITAVLPPGTNLPAAQSIAEPYGRRLELLENPGIQSQLREGELYCLTTAGRCDCGTSLGLVGKKRPLHQVNKAKRRAALGWSKAKIERAIEQAARSSESSAKQVEMEAAADTENWIEFIAAIHAAGIPYIGLMLHFYETPLSQIIQLVGRVTVHSGAQAREVLPLLAEDTIYKFRTET